MTEEEAIEYAREWVARKKEVRKHLLARARRQHPRPTNVYRADREVRKLYRFTTDLNEERLLQMGDVHARTSQADPAADR